MITNHFCTSYFSLVLLALILFCRCHTGAQDVPEAYLGFEVDTTIVEVADLPKVINESSGIIHWNDALWLHNDSKKQEALFAVDEQGSLLRTVHIADRENIDWEDMAQDDQYIYIGDFGNNHGNRRDLQIYKIQKSDIQSGLDSIATVGKIEFSYPDQNDFSGPTHGHNYDCEGMIVVGDSIYLFSKNFEDRQSRLYSLPKEAGRHTATLKDKFDVKGNITGADINPATDEVALSGYYYDAGTFYPFLWLFSDYPEQSFFAGKQQRYNFDFLGQIEGVCYQDGSIYICAESSMLQDGKLYRLDQTTRGHKQ